MLQADALLQGDIVPIMALAFHLTGKALDQGEVSALLTVSELWLLLRYFSFNGMIPVAQPGDSICRAAHVSTMFPSITGIQIQPNGFARSAI